MADRLNDVDFISKIAYNLESQHIAIIHSYRVSVINSDNKMITLAHIGRIIWIYQIIKRYTYSTENDT